jgi:hypothetical protein
MNYNSFCRQVVTVHHQQTAGQYTAVVLPCCCLSNRISGTVDKQGESTSHRFLLIVPGETQAVSVGDKLTLGDEAAAASREAWVALSAADSYVGVASTVEPVYWNGRITHWEVSG